MTRESRVSQIIADDPYLTPFQGVMEHRVEEMDNWISKINQTETNIDKFTRGHESLGFNILDNGIMYREWAPAVKEASLTGDFSIHF